MCCSRPAKRSRGLTPLPNGAGWCCYSPVARAKKGRLEARAPENKMQAEPAPVRSPKESAVDVEQQALSEKSDHLDWSRKADRPRGKRRTAIFVRGVQPPFPFFPLKNKAPLAGTRRREEGVFPGRLWGGGARPTPQSKMNPQPAALDRWRNSSAVQHPAPQRSPLHSTQIARACRAFFPNRSAP